MELNQSIVSQPVVFFLGAGSSVPFGMPTTLSFRQVLLDKSDKSERKLIKDLYECASSRYRLSVDSINLEEFLQFLHELRLGLWILCHSDLRSSVSAPMAKLGREPFGDADVQVNRARRKALSVLHEVCGDCLGDKVNQLWEPLFSGLKEFGNVFPIFTLNYDWAFEKLAISFPSRYNLLDGFSSLMGGHWSEKYFDNFQPQQGKTNLCLFKLHGSTCWVGGIKSLGSFTDWEKDPTYAFETEDTPPFEIVYPGHEREVSLGDEYWSMPGLDTDLQVGWREKEPYSLLHEYFDSCLSRTRILVVIGYAFGDRDINDRLMKALRMNENLHLVTLDPGIKWHRKATGDTWYEAPYYWKLVLADTSNEFSSRLHWIRGRFGTKTSTVKLLAWTRRLSG